METTLGLSPGFQFNPDDDDLVEHYLFPRLLRQRVSLDGIIVDDDPLSAPPGTLLAKHGREEEAFFFAAGQAVNGKTGGKHQKRRCAGGGCWAGQKVLVEGEKLCVGGGTGMEIVWRKYMLNFHVDGGDGSTGWVMHEYSITSPTDLAASSTRLYRIRLSGYGANSAKKRKISEPDSNGGDESAAARAAPRRRSAEAGGPADLPVEQQHASAPSRSVSPSVVVDLTDEDDYGPDLGASAGAPAAATSSAPDQDRPADATDDPAACSTSSSDEDLSLDLDLEGLENIDLDELFTFPDLDPCDDLKAADALHADGADEWSFVFSAAAWQMGAIFQDEADADRSICTTTTTCYGGRA